MAASVRKTGRALVAHEDTRSWGYGAELAARIGDRLFEHLDAPVRRVGALDSHLSFRLRRLLEIPLAFVFVERYVNSPRP